MPVFCALPCTNPLAICMHKMCSLANPALPLHCPRSTTPAHTLRPTCDNANVAAQPRLRQTLQHAQATFEPFASIKYCQPMQQGNIRLRNHSNHRYAISFFTWLRMTASNKRRKQQSVVALTQLPISSLLPHRFKQALHIVTQPQDCQHLLPVMRLVMQKGMHRLPPATHHTSCAAAYRVAHMPPVCT